MSVSTSSARSSFDSLRDDFMTLSFISVPDTLPMAVKGPMTWKGSELKNYIVELSEQDIASIRSAVLFFKYEIRKDRSEINQTTFGLPSALAQKLSAVSKELHNGQGIVVLRGLRKARFNDEEAVIAFAGINSYVCPLRATDSYANQTLSHVRDATHETVPGWAKNIGLAGSKVTSAMDFHSDRFSGDIIALHVRNDGGANGGEQFVSSFWSIYNELLDKEPEVLETMAAADWPFELKQKDSNPYLELGPTLFFSKGRPICQLVKAPLLGSPRIPRDPSMPALTDKQLHALHVVQSLAKQFATKLDRQTGDIQYLNNLSIMHARAAYGKKGERSTRHLLRMFLRDPENEWEKPASWRHNFDDPFTPGRYQELPVLDLDPYGKISGRESHG